MAKSGDINGLVPSRYRCWFVALGANIGLMVGYSATVTTVFGQLAGPIAEDLAISQSSVAAAIGLAIYPVIVLSPIAGLLVERVGAIKTILISQCLLFAAVAFVSSSRTEWELKLAFLCVGIAGTGTLPVSYTHIVLQWFDRRRGLALGIALAGVGSAAALLAPLTNYLIREGGWRSATMQVGGLMLILGVVNLMMLLRREPTNPEEIDGGTIFSSIGDFSAGGETVSRDIYFSKSFIVLAVAFCALGIVTIGSIVSLPSVLVQRGMTSEAASRYIAVFGAAMILARLFAGWLLDRFPPSAVIAFVFGAPVFGIFGLAYDGATLAVFWMVLLAIGFGGEFDVMAYILSRKYGRSVYPRLYSITYAAYNVGAGVGPFLLARSLEVSGEYRIGLISFGLTMMAAGAGLASVSKNLRSGEVASKIAADQARGFLR